jgi:hypothetical protein
VKKQALAKARAEALSIDRPAAAQQLAIEVGVVGADMESLAAETKELQRQSYFVSLERQRKRKLAKALQTELDVELSRMEIEKQIAADVKKVGVIGALAKFRASNGIGSIAAAAKMTEVESGSGEDGEKEDEVRRQLDLQLTHEVGMDVTAGRVDEAHSHRSCGDDSVRRRNVGDEIVNGIVYMDGNEGDAGVDGDDNDEDDGDDNTSKLSATFQEMISAQMEALNSDQEHAGTSANELYRISVYGKNASPDGRSARPNFDVTVSAEMPNAAADNLVHSADTAAESAYFNLSAESSLQLNTDSSNVHAVPSGGDGNDYHGSYDDDNCRILRHESTFLQELEEAYENTEQAKEQELEEVVEIAEAQAAVADQLEDYDPSVLDALAQNGKNPSYDEDEVDKFNLLLHRQSQGNVENTFDGFAAFESEQDPDAFGDDEVDLGEGDNEEGSYHDNFDRFDRSFSNDDEVSITSSVRASNRLSLLGAPSSAETSKKSTHSRGNSHGHGPKASVRLQQALDNIANGISDEMEQSFNYVVETTSSKLRDETMPIYVEEMVNEWELRSVHSKSSITQQRKSLSESINSNEGASNDAQLNVAESADGTTAATEAAGSGFSFAKLMKKVY